MNWFDLLASGTPDGPWLRELAPPPEAVGPDYTVIAVAAIFAGAVVLITLVLAIAGRRSKGSAGDDGASQGSGSPTRRKERVP